MMSKLVGSRGGRIGAAVLAVGAAAAATSLGTGPSAASGEEDPDPISVEVLARHADFPDRVGVTFKRRLEGESRRSVINVGDAGTIVVARLVVQPGAAFPWHTHPGPVVVSVTEGDLVYQQASDCVEREYGTDEGFLDPGNRVHTAWNPGDQPTELVATFYGVPAGGAVTIPTADQTDRCS